MDFKEFRRGREIYTGAWIYGILGEEHGRTIIANENGVYTVDEKTVQRMEIQWVDCYVQREC